MSLADMVFGFLEDVEALPENTSRFSDGCDDGDEDDEDSCNGGGNKVFWEEQEQLLQVKFQIFQFSVSSNSFFFFFQKISK